MQKNKKVYVIEIRWSFKEIIVLENAKEFGKVKQYCKMNGWNFLAYSQIIL